MEKKKKKVEKVCLRFPIFFLFYFTFISQNQNPNLLELSYCISYFRFGFKLIHFPF